MTKLEAILMTYLRVYARRHSGNLYHAPHDQFLIDLLSLLRIHYSYIPRISMKHNKICFSWDYDCSNLDPDILSISKEANADVCKMLINTKKKLWIQDSLETAILEQMFGRMEYKIRIGKHDGRQYLICVGPIT